MTFLSHRITAIRNGQKASLTQVSCRLSKRPVNSVSQDTGFKVLISALKLLRREGFIRGFSFISRDKKKKHGADSKGEGLYLIIYLKYDFNRNPVIRSIFRTSKPGRRIYIASRSLWQPQTSTGFFVISTSKGLFTDVEARLRNLGGEHFFGIS